MRTVYQNPGLQLDFKHFVTDTWTDYVKNQVDVVGPHLRPGTFVTTNTMTWHRGFDHFRLHRILDLAAWDNYIPEGRYNWSANALLHDIVRGFKQKNYWVIETQAAFVNYGGVNRALDRGQMREMAWQAVGHGADALLYWQWRSALNGQEQYYGTLVGPDGEPVPAYGEANRIGGEFAKASAALADTSPRADVAMIQSYDSRWAIDFQRHHKDFDPTTEFAAFYKPQVHTAQNIDVISPDAALDRYKFVVAPALNVVSKAQAERLVAFVRHGGHLLLGPRSGFKDEYNALWTSRQPGPLHDFLGGHVEQFYALDGPVSVEGSAGSGKAAIWGEALTADAPDARASMRYGADAGWLSGQTAALVRKVGKGTVTYLGAWLDENTMRRFLTASATAADVKPLVEAPNDVEVAERRGAGKRVLILINHGDATRTLLLPYNTRNVLSGAAVKRSTTLAPHDVAVLINEGKTP